MHPPAPEALPGYAQRHETWHEITAVSTIGRRTMGVVPNYRLLRAATQIDATAASRLLLVHLIGYLGPDDESRPEQRFVVFPGNTRLSDELRCTPRSIQRQADELESKGFLRRCYNRMNRRTGFDLTPFAMQHEDVVAGVVAVHTRRREEREAAQLELSLEADRITRPDRSDTTSVSPQGDAGVAHNRKGHNKDDGGTAASVALDAFDWSRAATVAFGDSFENDRTWDQRDAVLAHISSAFTGGGRISHLGWATALQSLGRDRAVALYLVADRDPKRRKSPERYFGWLLRMSADGSHDVIVEAAGRATAAIAKGPRDGSLAGFATSMVPAVRRDDPGSTPAGARLDGTEASDDGARDVRGHGGSMESAAGDVPADRTVQAIPSGDDRRLHDGIRREMGDHLYQAWIARARCEMNGRDVVVTAPSAFHAGWIERNLVDSIAKAAGSRPGNEVWVKVRTAS